MSNKIDAIIKTRKIAADILVKSLVNIYGKSEIEIREKILKEISTRADIYGEGWYSPPPFGVCVLLDGNPYTRLQFKSLRNPSAWPIENSLLEKESVGIVYLSPVDKTTGMLGDIGLTIYNGENKEIKEHIRKCYQVIRAIAEKAEVGMHFNDLYKVADGLFENNLKIIEWMTTTNDPNLGINLGHTIPGSYDDNLNPNNSFEEIKDFITKKRIYINKAEDFKIPETCAFTVESRLVDKEKIYLPNVFFHFVVCFNKGEKTILDNFDKIFSTVGMDYMNIK